MAIVNQESFAFYEETPAAPPVSGGRSFDEVGSLEKFIFTDGELADLHCRIMKAIARIRHMPAAAVVAADFSQQRPANRIWRMHARLRRMATYLIVVEFGWARRAAIARALGISKAAITKQTDLAEDERDARFDLLVDRVRAEFAGERRLA